MMQVLEKERGLDDAIIEYSAVWLNMNHCESPAEP